MIEAYFLKSQKSITVEGITQGDYGQQLAIQGLNLPTKVEVHYALTGDNSGIRMYGTTAGGITTADIPNTLIAKGRDIIAYIFVSDANEGKTVRTIRIPVTPKPDIEDVELPPDDEDIVRELIVVVNDMKGTLDTLAYTEIQEDGIVELPIHTINDTDVSENSTWSSQKIEEKFGQLPDSYFGRDYLRTIVVKYPDMGPGLSLGVDVEYPPGFTIENSVVLTYSCKYVRYVNESNQTNKVKIPHTQPEDVSIYLYPSPSTGTLKGAISNIGQAGTFVLKDIYLAVTFLCIDKKG